MRRWIDFERDRRYRSGMQSRDSTYDVLYRSGSPNRSGSTRHSIVSSADTYLSGGMSSYAGDVIFRQASPGLPGGSLYASESEGHISGSTKFPTHLELPAPLSVSNADSGDNSPQLTPQHPLPVYDYPRYEYDSEEEREGILAGDSALHHSTSSPYLRAHTLRTTSPHPYATLDNGSDRSEYLLPSPLSATSDSAFREEPTALLVPRLPSVVSSAQRRSRGVSLVDPGPVAGVEGGMRTVQRHSRRI